MTSQGCVRRAGPQDAARIEAFLAQHPATSMFLRGNLAAFGTENTDHPHGTAFYVPDAVGPVDAVFGITNGGFVMAQAPDAPPEIWVAFARQIAGRSVAGMTGVPEQVQKFLTAAGLNTGPFSVLADEPLYHLVIADMTPMPAQVRVPRADDLALLETWYATYELDVGQAQPEDPLSPATRARAARAIDSEDVVILEEAGVPVAMAGINARLPDIVQVGGVFTPDGMRGNGYARRAVAGLLRRCAAQGVTQSLLFANSAAAARAYEALGYQRVGDYRVALLRSPATVTPAGSAI
jgi:predicted GNAT family acetyltransferase